MPRSFPISRIGTMVKYWNTMPSVHAQTKSIG